MSEINLIPEFSFGTFPADKEGALQRDRKIEGKKGQTVTGFYFRWFGFLILLGKKNF